MNNYKIILTILLVFSLFLIGCNKDTDGNEDRILSIEETVNGEGKVVLEVCFQDESKMYFRLMSPNTVEVANRIAYYGNNSSEGYQYRGNVTIPYTITHKGTTYSVVRIGASAFEGNTLIGSVVMPNTISVIDYSAFKDCINLSEVVLGESTNIIGEFVFWGCEKLSSIVFPNSLTCIGMASFRNCYGLTSIIIPNSVISDDQIGDGTIGSYFAFQNCINLSNVTIGSSVTSLFGTFSGCTKLTTVNCLPTVPPANGGAFIDCPLEVIYVPNESVNDYKTEESWSQFADIIVGM